MLAAAPIGLRVAAHVDVVTGTPALAAPFRARDAHHAGQIAALSGGCGIFDNDLWVSAVCLFW